MGRFIGLRTRLLDPEVYSKGREVTVIGNIQSTAVRKLGEYDTNSLSSINAEQSIYGQAHSIFVF